MKTKAIYTLLFILGFIIKSFSQDINFMFYSNTSLNVNPAIISASNDFKIAANYNNKSYINDINAKSTYLMLSRPLYKNNVRFGGFGVSVFSNRGGDTQQLIYEGITGAYAHEVQLTSWSRLSLGLQAAYQMKRIDTREFTTGSQWIEGFGYDPVAGNGEEFEQLTASNFTLNSGLFWYIPNENKSVKFYLGFAMFNLTKPKYSFFGAEQAEPFKYVANTGYEVYSEGKLSIIPQVLYYNSYNRHNWTIGSKWAYLFNITNESRFLSSGSIDLITAYRVNEGGIVGFWVNQPDFSFGIGYGFSDKYSNQYTPDKGSVEISFTYRKSLYRKPKKEKNIIVTKEGYYEGQQRELAFEEPEKIEKKTEIKEIVEEINVNELKKEPERNITFKLNKDFNFGFNKAELNDEAKSYIDDIVILLSNNKMLKIEIIGHTDNVGTRAANKKISEQRAEVVQEYLLEKGIDPGRITMKGVADKYPLYKNETPENRSKNRRVEFLIYY